MAQRKNTWRTLGHRLTKNHQCIGEKSFSAFLSLRYSIYFSRGIKDARYRPPNTISSSIRSFLVVFLKSTLVRNKASANFDLPPLRPALLFPIQPHSPSPHFSQIGHNMRCLPRLVLYHTLIL